MGKPALRARLIAIALVVLLFSFCAPVEPPFPGDEVIGAFAFNTVAPVLEDGGLDPSIGNCPLPELRSGNFGFQGTLSRQRGSSEAWITLNAVSHPATFDGQAIVSSTSVTRDFTECDGGVAMTETLNVVLLSASQNAVLGSCPADALDGGVPLDVDAGIVGPGTTAQGFDAVRACGVLIDSVLPGAVCQNGFPTPEQPCSMTYPLSGVRE